MGHSAISSITSKGYTRLITTSSLSRAVPAGSGVLKNDRLDF